MKVGKHDNQKAWINMEVGKHENPQKWIYRGKVKIEDFQILEMGIWGPCIGHHFRKYGSYGSVRLIAQAICFDNGFKLGG